MKFKVVLYETEEGFAVFCPGLRGCVSQGDTREEALENIQSGIREYPEVSWIVFKRNMGKDLEGDDSLKVSSVRWAADIRGVEEAEAEEAEVVI